MNGKKHRKGLTSLFNLLVYEKVIKRMMPFSAYRVKIRDRHVRGKWSDFTVVHVDDEEDVYYWLERYRKVERIAAESLSIYKETDIRKETEIEKLITYQGYNEGEVYPHDSTITPAPILAIRRRYMKKNY